MKKSLLLVLTLFSSGLYAQEHFAGINTSRRTGIINATVNPAELTNLKNKYEVNIFNFSANVSNNKMTFGDLVGGSDDFEDMIFSGNEPVNMKADIEILGPAFAYKIDKWAFAITTSAKIKADIHDVDTGLGRALTTDTDILDIAGSYITAGSNQRVSGTSWGEVGFSAARDIFENDTHKFSGGITFKLIFPGSYANMAADQFNGDIALGTGANTGDVVLKNANADINVAYSGSLADGFTDAGNFTDFFAGGLNGFSTDFGFNYRWKDPNNDEGYKVNAGLSVRNLGSMTFKDNNNVSKNYRLETTGAQEFNLSQFEGVDDLKEVEAILQSDPNIQFVDTKSDFKVKQSAVLSTYADFKVYNNWYVTGFLQQRLSDESKNDQLIAQNIFTVTPRYSGEWFEAYAPISSNEISGFTAGLGVRLGGFYIGSGSILSAALGNTNQADAYLGFRFGF
ncbi:hypothetical protein [Flavobacterium sp. NRK1]|uniref:hypothetical protein n=1 Tax=Flavobacterium sp. NRK1 TaxID=2954929 RepID=UPI002091F00C|nr:hypothetical protein [Flavobacterium sp. NRK1]MCO6149277.1 hypothetical protein [Flavobacterium sp. NRK1]